MADFYITVPVAGGMSIEREHDALGGSQPVSIPTDPEGMRSAALTAFSLLSQERQKYLMDKATEGATNSVFGMVYRFFEDVGHPADPKELVIQGLVSACKTLQERKPEGGSLDLGKIFIK